MDVLTASEWATQTWAQVALGDQRLTRRAVAIGAKMAADPAASLPNQVEEPAALKAAYRMLNHPAVSLENLTAPHRQHTLVAAGHVAHVLMVEDTTELDYTAHPGKTGLGPIGDGRGQGLLLHSTLAVVPDRRQVLGLAHVQVVRRQAKPKSHPHWSRSPEGRVWETSAQAVGRPPAGVVWIHVSDRGSDMFEYMAACLSLDKHFLIRAFHNRVLDWSESAPSVEADAPRHLFDAVRARPAEPGSAYLVSIPAREHQPARQACLALQWQRVTFAPPAQAPPTTRRSEPIRLCVLRAWEPDPPPNVEALEWILLTSLPVTTGADAHRLTEWYTCRWLCEDYHQCLKSGCRLERTQLDAGNDVERLLGFAAPIAVRLLQLRQAARLLPDLPAESVVDPLMVCLLARRQQTDGPTMTTEQFWRGVARLGGHQGRRRDGPPGWRTL